MTIYNFNINHNHSLHTMYRARTTDLGPAPPPDPELWESIFKLRHIDIKDIDCLEWEKLCLVDKKTRERCRHVKPDPAHLDKKVEQHPEHTALVETCRRENILSSYDPDSTEERVYQRLILIMASQRTENQKTFHSWYVKSLLLRYKVFGSIDKLNGHGKSLLHMAVSFGDEDIVRLLLELGANPNVSDNSEKVPLYYAFTNDKINRLLIANGSKVDIINMKGKTPLGFAIAWNDYETVKLLLPRVDLSHDVYKNPKPDRVPPLCAMVIKIVEREERWERGVSPFTEIIKSMLGHINIDIIHQAFISYQQTTYIYDQKPRVYSILTEFLVKYIP